MNTNDKHFDELPKTNSRTKAKLKIKSGFYQGQQRFRVTTRTMSLADFLKMLVGSGTYLRTYYIN